MTRFDGAWASKRRSDALVEQLYSAALSPQEWPDAIAGLQRLLHADHVLLRHLGSDEKPRFASAGLDDQSLARFRDYYPTDPAPRPLGPSIVLYAPGAVISSSDIVSDTDLERSAVYNEVIRPAKGFYSLTTMAPGAAAFNLSVCRSRAAGAYGQVECETLSAILPHVAMALEVSHRLAVADRRQSGWLSMLERMRDGVVLCEAGAAPNFLNARAADILGEKDGLALIKGGLCAASADTTRLLVEAIAQAARGDGQTLRLAVRRPSGRLPLVLSILPVWRLGAALTADSGSSVAVFIQEADDPAPVQTEVIADIFRLTRREAQVASLLAGGAPLSDIAQQLELGIGTVRSHLKQIFQKTDVRSQVALVALLRSCNSRWD